MDTFIPRRSGRPRPRGGRPKEIDGGGRCNERSYNAITKNTRPKIVTLVMSFVNAMDNGAPAGAEGQAQGRKKRLKRKAMSEELHR